jgi:Coenzyme PQQ synthesis protein D (PqqD)
VSLAQARSEEPSPDNGVLAWHASVPAHVVYRSFVNETVVLNLETGRYHGLNPVGGRMLEALDREETVAGAVGRLAGEFGDVAPGQLERDVCSFCADLRARGLIEVAPHGGRR